MPETSAAHFRPEILEKVRRLQSILVEVDDISHLKGKFALKGGTALNLFLTDLRRLSVDIDLNFLEDCTTDELIAHRAIIHKAIETIASKLQLKVRRKNNGHAGEKWFLRYEPENGIKGEVQVDINYVLRIPLFNPERRTSTTTAGLKPIEFTLANPHEIAAGKLVALIARSAPRDIFDAAIYSEHVALDDDALRVAFVVLGASNIEDWTEAGSRNWSCDPRTLREDLLPLLRRSHTPAADQTQFWADNLHAQALKFVSRVLPFKDNELEFLKAITQKGEIRPNLLTENISLRDRIARLPIILWKVKNVKQHLGPQAHKK